MCQVSMTKSKFVLILIVASTLAVFVSIWNETPWLNSKHLRKLKANAGQFMYGQKSNTFTRYLPPDQDVNCVSTIPENFRDTSADSLFVIPSADALNKLTLHVLTCLYHRFLQTLSRHCTHPSRVGNVKDGGWHVCTDPNAIPTKPCLVYSFSDGRVYGSFAEEMAKTYGCHVVLFNPKKYFKNTTPDNLEQFSSKLETENGTSVENMSKTLKQKSQETINVLTLDLNNREWDVIPKLLSSGILEKSEQLSVRFHNSRNASSVEHYIKRLNVLRNLHNSGFRIFWSDRDASCLHVKRKETGCYFINMIRITNRPSPIIIPSDHDISLMKSYERGEFFQRYITSVQIACKELIRIGKIPDGGWDVCHDPEYRPRNTCTVYSFGIANDFSFDDDVARTYGCKVYSFDPSMKQKDHRHSSNVMFYATGISNHNGYVKKGNSKWKMRKLSTIMEELGHKEEIIDILKMDVEWSEWASIPEMISSGALKHVRQFAFEIHMSKLQDNAENYKKALSFFRDIYNVGFRIFWTHRNVACAFRTKKGQYRSFCNEIYTVNIY